jgi:hypothetical protein
MLSAVPDATGVTLTVQAPSNSIWSVESKDSMAGTQNWQLVGSWTNGTATNFVMRDTGQDGRPPPQSVKARFYRVVPY